VLQLLGQHRQPLQLGQDLGVVPVLGWRHGHPCFQLPNLREQILPLCLEGSDQLGLARRPVRFNGLRLGPVFLLEGLEASMNSRLGSATSRICTNEPRSWA
jgi:hypothetical protein